METGIDSGFSSFDKAVRERLLDDFEKETSCFNLHCHSFYSYNGYGLSPTALAVLAKKNNWRCVGMVDFDVLDGVDEFLAACRRLSLRGIAGMETRVFIPELAKDEINSPGEPGIAYHLGYGFAKAAVPAQAEPFARLLREKARERTRRIVTLVNGFLQEIALDFDEVAAAYTPAGNVTERHVCLAYRVAAEKRFADPNERRAYWTQKLGSFEENPVKLEALIRSKTMKKGGVGYVQATADAFPTLDEMNAFVAACGAVPTVAWLNGLSDGEKDPGKLLDLHIAHGAGAITLIPDRNWNVADAAKKEALLAAMARFVDAAEERGLPILIGTEMNAPGQKLADDLTVPELAPFRSVFVKGLDAFEAKRAGK